MLEAASWRLASELARRHPAELRVIRTFPATGQYDCLTLISPAADATYVQLNRHGTIQVHGRYDGREPGDWTPVPWEDYLRADPRGFLARLEAAAGLGAPATVPAAKPWTLVYRIIAAITSTAIKSVHPVEAELGYIDSSAYGEVGPNPSLSLFGAIAPELLLPRADDILGEPGYRFWILKRDGTPILAFETLHGIAWTRSHGVGFSLNDLYQESRRHLLVTALKLLRRVDHV